jgi:Tfp pilus assembly protein PilF
MYNIIPLILILISLIIIIIIVARKFTVLANLDIESIQAEREAKFKERIISNRLRRSYLKYSNKLKKILDPAGKLAAGLFKSSLDKLLDFKESYKEEENLKKGIMAEESELEKLRQEAEELIRREDFEVAEKKLLEVIKQDSRNVKSFRGLAKIYSIRKDYAEARQTLEHVLKLTEKDYNKMLSEELAVTPEEREDKKTQLSGIYCELASNSLGEENYDSAMSSIERALALEPNNPRYLDTKFEISIIKKDKIKAHEAYEKLSAVNPENQKLGDFRKRMSEI